jgi:hypothetical protein
VIPWLPIGLAAGVILGIVATVAVSAALSAGRRGGLIEIRPTVVQPSPDDWWRDAA